MENTKLTNSDDDLEITLRAFESDFVAFGSRAIKDSNVRERYRKLVAEVSREVRLLAVRTGKYSDAAELAVRLRNEVMGSMRSASSDISREFAFHFKKDGKTLDFLLNKASLKIHQKAFSKLSDPSSHRKVFLEVIESCGRTNKQITKFATVLGKAGKGFIVASVGIAIYEVATAEDKAREIGKQSVSIGLGSALASGGGWVGAFCGPGAMVCVPLGVFIGGALGAVATEYIF